MELRWTRRGRGITTQRWRGKNGNEPDFTSQSKAWHSGAVCGGEVQRCPSMERGEVEVDQLGARIVVLGLDHPIVDEDGWHRGRVSVQPGCRPIGSCGHSDQRRGGGRNERSTHGDQPNRELRTNREGRGTILPRLRRVPGLED